MKNLSLIFSVLLNLLPGIIWCQSNSTDERCIPCEALKDLQMPDVRITKAVVVTEGSLHCKILGVIGREINFELLLPEKWNGIFIMGGGGGFVGTIQNAARSSVNLGYATSGTDTGHSNEKPDWAIYNMERQLNFGHLAVHRTAEVSKAIIGSYYGSNPRYCYFFGCSRGGGQAMMEAQRYPDDFDGIVAAAPAFNWPAIAAEFIQNTKAVYPFELTQPVISEDHIRILHEAVMKQCDRIDGISDSILQNPSACKFDFTVLPICKGNMPGKDCFTKEQIDVLKIIYEGVDLGNGVSYPGFPFGGEYEPGSWIAWITGSSENLTRSGYPSLQAYFGIEIFKYLILQDPDWDYSTYNFKGYEKEIRYASAYLDATSTDYSIFKNRNGKIIFWHGWNDPALSALATIEHYNTVKANDPQADNYMKLFLLPGVLHCGGGKGPSGVDWITLIREWVENGNPPEKVIASKVVNGKQVMTRTVFPYPDETVIH